MSTGLPPGGQPSESPLPGGEHEQNQHGTGFDPDTQAGLEVANPRSPNQDKYWVPPAAGGGLSPSVKPDDVRPAVELIRPPRKRIMGMRRTTFVLAVLLALVSVVAGVVGGVAGSKAVSDARTSCLSSACPSGSGPILNPNGSTPITGAFEAPTDVLLKLDCPRLNNTKQTITLGGGAPAKSWTFTPYCSADYNDVKDIGAFIAYSFRDCLQACASMNLNAGKNVCLGVEFNADMKSIIPDNYGNCFLKPKLNPPNVYGRNLNVGGALDT